MSPFLVYSIQGYPQKNASGCLSVAEGAEVNRPLPLTPLPYLCLQGPCRRPWHTMEALQRTRGFFYPPVCERHRQSTPRPLHTNSLRYRSTRRSSAPSDLTAATQKRYKPATDWTLFTKEDSAFWHCLTAAKRTARRRHQHRSTQSRLTKRFAPERAAKRYTPFSTARGENCLLKHT